VLHPLQNTSTGFGARQSSGAVVIGIPQRPQNFVPKGYSWRQRGQVIPLEVAVGACRPPVTGSKIVLPQRPQNFTPSAKREWHFVHITTASVVECAPCWLSRLPAREGVN
jgi:hypothetical protein